jgi:hypothetical protein
VRGEGLPATARGAEQVHELLCAGDGERGADRVERVERVLCAVQLGVDDGSV